MPPTGCMRNKQTNRDLQKSDKKEYLKGTIKVLKGGKETWRDISEPSM